MHFFVIVFVVCVASWCCSHYAVPTYKYMYLQFSQKWFENEGYREDMFFLNSTSLLKLFSLLYHLIRVVSVLSTQRRRKSKDWLARNQYVFTLRDMSTTSQKCCCSVMVIYQSSSACWASEKWYHYQDQISNAMYSLMPALCFYSAVF
jgi:hypothetical protein